MAEMGSRAHQCRQGNRILHEKANAGWATGLAGGAGAHVEITQERHTRRRGARSLQHKRRGCPRRPWGKLHLQVPGGDNRSQLRACGQRSQKLKQVASCPVEEARGGMT